MTTTFNAEQTKAEFNAQSSTVFGQDRSELKAKAKTAAVATAVAATGIAFNAVGVTAGIALADMLEYI